MNVDNLKRILPFDSGSQLDTSSQKYMLVPESLYQQKMKIDTRDVMQSIKQPEQREMLKRYQLAQNILHDNQRVNDDTKMNEYHEMMQDFSMLRDRQGSMQEAR